jgi:hypothetical protein
LEIVLLLCCSKEGLESVGLAPVTEDVLNASHPVLQVVDPTNRQNPRSTTHPLPLPGPMERLQHQYQVPGTVNIRQLDDPRFSEKLKREDEAIAQFADGAHPQ